MKGIPVNTSEFNFRDTTVNIPLSDNKIFPLQVRTDRVIKTPALRWWLSDLQTDAENKWVWGYFNMVVSVRDGYTARLESITVK